MAKVGLVRHPIPGIGEAVATSRILRQEAGQFEDWGGVAHRVALGNVGILGSLFNPEMEREYEGLRRHIAQASILMSGRHLQHGDATQPGRNMEVFTNCLERSTRLVTLEFGPVEIGSIEGETVHVLAKDGEWRQAEVKKYGTQKLYRVEFGSKNGGKLRHVVDATANHRWFLRSGSVTDSLKVGDVIAAPESHTKRDSDAVVHGLLFGDGTAHKTRSDTHRVGVSYGRSYASIRICKQDAVQDEVHDIFDAAGYRYTTPPHAKGDRVYYLGKYPYAKELPCTTDADYIEGFIYGWWLADGYKKYDYSDAVVLSTSDAEAVEWLRSHAAYAGYSVVSLRKQERQEGDGSYANGKPLYTIRLRKGVEWVVRSIEPLGEDEVFCVEEPVTQSFTLANGLLTGNCSTAATSAIKLYLLLNGSGVGRDYSDDLMVVDWNNMPDLVLTLDRDHADATGEFPTTDEVMEQYTDPDYFLVPDSREGWAKAVEIVERLAFEGTHKHRTLVLDFSVVRPEGSPIGGMQNRPASGPLPLMRAIQAMSAVKDSGMAPWLQTMTIDHHLAACVAVGGVRRAARIAVKWWGDPGIFDFIEVKNKFGLWSANNSVAVDAEFWKLVEAAEDIFDYNNTTPGLRAGDFLPWEHEQGLAWDVFQAISQAQYEHGTGEPGYLNVDRINRDMTGFEVYDQGTSFIGSDKYTVDPETEDGILRAVIEVTRTRRYPFIVNPCGEIPLLVLGGYCVIADTVPFHCESLEEALDAFRTATRALIRVNLMDSLYQTEVHRTNRIGVGMTGIFEFAWKFFGLGFRDLLDETGKGKPFWDFIAQGREAIIEEARRYSAEVGLPEPHTSLTLKPAGTTSKLYGLTEAAHNPAKAWYLRFIQLTGNETHKAEEYEAKGYPVFYNIKNEQGAHVADCIVGFPTRQTLLTLDIPEDKVVLADEATMEEQYRWVALLEKHWLGDERGGQISYTLKYSTDKVSFEEYKRIVLEHQPKVRAISVMPSSDWRETKRKYGYVPEEPISKREYDAIVASITLAEEMISEEHLMCEGGACPL